MRTSIQITEPGEYRIEKETSPWELILLTFIVFFGPWVVMLAYGSIRLNFTLDVPALGYLEILLYEGALLLILAVIFFKTTNYDITFDKKE